MKIFIFFFIIYLDYILSQSSEMQCAKWSCGFKSEGDLCGHSEITTEMIPSVTIYKPCDRSQKICEIAMRINSVYTNPVQDYKCMMARMPEPVKIEETRYPGEVCAKASECKAIHKVDEEGEIRECVKGKCLGYRLGDEVEKDYQCEAGLFPMKPLDYLGEKRVCTPQIDSICTNTFECYNDLVCYNSQCIEYFSIEDLIDPTLTDIENHEVLSLLCKTGYMNQDYECADLIDYAGKTLAKEIDLEGFVQCEYREDCIYSDGSVQKCQCGINYSGFGYCERPPARCININFNKN